MIQHNSGKVNPPIIKILHKKAQLILCRLTK
nr:MAG TPA: hypothetical protein [Caudoviricetes sp.]